MQQPNLFQLYVEDWLGLLEDNENAEECRTSLEGFMTFVSETSLDSAPTKETLLQFREWVQKQDVSKRLKKAWLFVALAFLKWCATDGLFGELPWGMLTDAEEPRPQLPHLTGRNVREWRKVLGLSEKEFADSVGAVVQTIRSWEETNGRLSTTPRLKRNVKAFFRREQETFLRRQQKK